MMKNDNMRLFALILAILYPALSWCSNNNLVVEVNGLDREEKKIILSALSIKKVEKEKNLNKERIASFYQLALSEITTALEAIGYYHPNIHAKLLATSNGFLAKYQIDPGPSVLIKTVSIQLIGEGQHHPELINLIKKSPLIVNQSLNHKTYEHFKQKLLARALQLGYLDAIYNTNEILVDLNTNLATIHLDLDTGKQYKMGQISFVSSPYPPEYLKRYIPFSEGYPYTTDQLLSLQKAFIDSELFTKVRIDPELNKSKHFTVPLKVKLTPKAPNKYTASIGFGTDSGPRGMLGWEHRRKSHPGHRIDMNIKGSKRLNQANAQYVIPGRDPATDRLTFGTHITEEKPRDKKYSLRHETGINYFQKRGRVENILSIQYLAEIDRLLPSLPKRRLHFLLPKMGFVWGNVNRATLMQSGMRFSFSVQGGLQPLLSSTNLLQAEAKLKWIYPLGELTRFIIRSDLGATTASKTDKIPWSLLYSAGGDYTVRGYGYNTLGPRKLDPSGNEIVVGGRNIFIGSLELERRIYKNIGTAIFFDSGNAMNKWNVRLANSAGFGVRYQTPLGPLRIDIAQALPRGRHKPRIHLTFGMDL